MSNVSLPIRIVLYRGRTKILDRITSRCDAGEERGYTEAIVPGHVVDIIPNGEVHGRIDYG